MVVPMTVTVPVPILVRIIVVIVMAVVARIIPTVVYRIRVAIGRYCQKLCIGNRRILAKFTG